MSLVWWLWLSAACVVAVSAGGFVLLLVDRMIRKKWAKAIAVSRDSILRLLADGQLTDSELRRQVRATDRQGVLASVVLEALSLILGTPRRVFIDRLASAGATTRLRRRARTGARNARLQAITALGAVSDGGAAACLKRLWRDPDPWVRLAALTASLETALPPGFDTAISRAAAVGPQLRGRAQRLVRAVASANIASARDALPRRNLPSWLRLQLLETLRLAPDASLLPQLLTAAMDPDTELRAVAVGALGEIGTPAACAAIIDAIDDVAWLVRVQAVSAAGALKLETARVHLAHRLEDENWWVRLRAGEAMHLLDEISPVVA